MQTFPLTSDFSVCPQLSERDIALLARRGVRSIINNRPDGEASDQPRSATLAAAAAAAGVSYHELPVAAGAITEEHVDRFAHYLAELPAPQVAFCRTGTRAATLWALASARAGMPANDILVRAAQAGYDLAALLPRLTAAQPR